MWAISEVVLQYAVCDMFQVQEGVRALVEYIHKKEGSVSLLNETQNIHLQLTFKKVPEVANKIIRM